MGKHNSCKDRGYQINSAKNSKEEKSNVTNCKQDNVLHNTHQNKMRDSLYEDMLEVRIDITILSHFY